MKTNGQKIISGISCCVFPLLMVATGFYYLFSFGFSFGGILAFILCSGFGGILLAVIWGVMQRDFKNRKKKSN
jgi:hypothetical protein